MHAPETEGSIHRDTWLACLWLHMKTPSIRSGKLPLLPGRASIARDKFISPETDAITQRKRKQNLRLCLAVCFLEPLGDTAGVEAGPDRRNVRASAPQGTESFFLFRFVATRRAC